MRYLLLVMFTVLLSCSKDMEWRNEGRPPVVMSRKVMVAADTILIPLQPLKDTLHTVGN